MAPPAAPDEPWAALEREAAVVRTPCGAGEMVWRRWGAGRPLVLLHGGAGSWLHWLPTIEAFRATREVIAPDLPGLGLSADVPPEADDGGMAIVASGLGAVLGGRLADLVGFSFGGVVAGTVAARLPVRSLTLVGAGGLGTIRASAKLERVRDKTGPERDAAHRTNLGRWMIADPARIGADAIAVQDWNSRRARFDSRPIGVGASLLDQLPRVAAPVAGIWGEHDHAVGGDTQRVRATLHRLRPDAAFHVIPGAGHWVAWEAPDRFAATLDRVLQREAAPHEHA